MLPQRGLPVLGPCLAALRFGLDPSLNRRASNSISAEICHKMGHSGALSTRKSRRRNILGNFLPRLIADPPPDGEGQAAHAARDTQIAALIGHLGGRRERGPCAEIERRDRAYREQVSRPGGDNRSAACPRSADGRSLVR